MSCFADNYLLFFDICPQGIALRTDLQFLGKIVRMIAIRNRTFLPEIVAIGKCVFAIGEQKTKWL